MPGRKAFPGQPFQPSATEWNRHVEAADWFHSRKRLGDATGAIHGGYESCCVQVQNTTGDARRQGEILEFDANALTDLSARQRVLTGIISASLKCFGVLLAPVADSEIADFCQVAGVCLAYVNVNDEAHEYAKPEDGNAVLQSAALGPVKILHKPSGTGEKTCIVSLSEGQYHFVGKAEETIEDGASGSVALYDAAFSAPLGVSLTCYNHCGDEITTDDNLAGFVVRGVGVVWPMTKGGGGGDDEVGDYVDIVQINNPDGSPGLEVSPTADGYHGGIVSRFTDGSLSQPAACWLLFVDDYDNALGDVAGVHGDYYGPARLSGTVASSYPGEDPTELPLYVVRKGREDDTARIVEWTSGGTGTKVSAVDGRWGPGDAGYLYFLSRLGSESVGISHDPTEAAPQTNGNFTVTKTGLYRICFFIDGQDQSTGTSSDFSHVTNVGFSYKPSGGSFTNMLQARTSLQNHYGITINTIKNSFVCLANLEAGTVIRISLADVSTGSGTAKWQLNYCTLSFERLGPMVSSVAIP